MNFNIPKFSTNINKITFRSEDKKAPYNQQTKPIPNDSFEMSIGYVNDTHGQTNNMMRILSGIKGDLRLSAGDNDIGDEKNKATHRATAKFLNLANIKATALGNHELDTTQTDFIDTLKDVDAHVLAVNFHKYDKWEDFEDNLEEYARGPIDKTVEGSTIVEVNGEKIGLIGASPVDMFDRLTHPSYHKDCNVDQIESTIMDIQEEIDELREKGINKIILLSHLGHQRDKAVAENTDGIDVIIGGHTHELLKGIKEGENFFYSASGEPVIETEAGKDGNYFGLLKLTFDKDGVITKAQNNIGETRLFYKNMINQYVFDEIMGKPEKIGYIKDAPPPPKTLIEENPHANFVCDAMKYVTNSDIAVWNNGGIRNFFHQGIIDSRDIKDIAPFFDRVSVANISEKAIVDLLKGSTKTSYSSHGFKPGLLAVSGLKYGVDEKKGELTFVNFVDKEGNEIPIDIENPREDKTYRLVTDEYMMSAGADYPLLATAEECLEIYPYDKDVMTCQYIKELDAPVVINQSGRIKFE